jgi:hypothetical protein
MFYSIHVRHHPYFWSATNGTFFIYHPIARYSMEEAVFSVINDNLNVDFVERHHGGSIGRFLEPLVNVPAVFPVILYRFNATATLLI